MAKQPGGIRRHYGPKPSPSLSYSLPLTVVFQKCPSSKRSALMGTSDFMAVLYTFRPQITQAETHGDGIIYGTPYTAQQYNKLALEKICFQDLNTFTVCDIFSTSRNCDVVYATLARCCDTSKVCDHFYLFTHILTLLFFPSTLFFRIRYINLQYMLHRSIKDNRFTIISFFHQLYITITGGHIIDHNIIIFNSGLFFTFRKIHIFFTI